MVLKGISQTMWIVIVIVILLVVAIVILGVFTGGIANFLAIFNPWANATAGVGACQTACHSLCAASPNLEGEPPGWRATSQDLNCERFDYECFCAAIGSGFPGLGGGSDTCPGTCERTGQDCEDRNGVLRTPNTQDCIERGEFCCVRR